MRNSHSSEVPLIELREVSIRRGDNWICRNLSFSIDAGEHLTIRGPSGCGKTSLLRCIALLDPLERGVILFNGSVVSSAGIRPRPSHELRLKIAMVFQQLFLWPHLSVLENVTKPLVCNGLVPIHAEETGTKILNRLGVGGKLSEFPFALSGGQQQRVALARVLVHAPALLLLDELTSNLDSGNALTVMSEITKLANSGTTLIFVSHTKTLPPPLSSKILGWRQNSWHIETLAKVRDRSRNKVSK